MTFFHYFTNVFSSVTQAFLPTVRQAASKSTPQRTPQKAEMLALQ